MPTFVPSTLSDAFDGSYIEYATLHVPDEAIGSYKTTEPWSRFGNTVGAATGISIVKDAATNADDVVYDLRGNKVEYVGKGIYIKNGRKVIMK